MVALFTDPRMLDHRPAATHPERPERLAAAIRQIERTGQMQLCDRRTVRPATDAELLLVHTPAHLEAIRRASGRDAHQVESDTWVSPGSDLAARLAAGAVIDAVDLIVRGEAARAFCLVRPPGHHARPADPMGFCLYASVAVAAAYATRSLGLSRVLVVDWDVHHGNGTQEIFFDDDRVGFYSIHRYPFYPGSGAIDETGSGRGLGWTRNVPISFGTQRSSFLATFRASLADFAAKVKPELVILSAGFDAHAEDPVGNLGLEIDDFEEMAREVIELIEAEAGGRLVSVLEGGYNVPILAGCVASHLSMLGARVG